MRLRRWISLIALIGVLLHAGALVRHNGMMLSVALAQDAPAADLFVICHGGADQTSDRDTDQPGLPKPADAKTSCPICSGQAPAFALAAPQPLLVRAVVAQNTVWRSISRARLLQRTAVCPPSRGPPQRA